MNTSSLILNRGFTGHEHLDVFKLINMNGRVYDPLTGRFLSPDNYVQAPDYTQSFNRYSYCFNNPLKFTDPSGWEITTINGGYKLTGDDAIRFFTYLQAEFALSCYKADINGEGGGCSILSFKNIWSFVNSEYKTKGSGRLSDGSRLISDIYIDRTKTDNGYKWVIDPTSFENAWHNVQGTLTPYALDPRTVGKNIIDSYVGPFNPRKYNGDYDYSYIPERKVNWPAIIHDLQYDHLGIKGASGLLFDTRAIGADWEFVSNQLALAIYTFDNPYEKFLQNTSAYFLGNLALMKTLIKLLDSNGFIEIAINYGISNSWRNK